MAPGQPTAASATVRQGSGVRTDGNNVFYMGFRADDSSSSP